VKKINRTLRRCCLSGLISLALFAPVPAVYAASIETGYSPEGTALQLVLKTIDSAQQEIRLMGYSFTSPEVAGALVRAKRRGVDVKVVLDWKANTGKQNQASLAAMNLLVNAGIPVRTVSQYKIMHDKVIIADGRNIEVGSFNYTRAADRVNSENVLVVWDDPVWLNAICSTGSLAGMAVLIGIHRTNDHIEHILSAPTGKMYFTLN
jgi:phosphatidylserine/phosphatidylglycerophosphate/cardiolipin synthase-like enzyme